MEFILAISTKDIKMLWSLCGGFCSNPCCREDLIEKDFLVGEMAHIIPQSEKGPRGNGVKGSDSYDNLILLCPTCHRKIDKCKNPEVEYPRELLLSWKRETEENRGKLRKSSYMPYRVYEVCYNVHSLLANVKYISAHQLYWMPSDIRKFLSSISSRIVRNSDLVGLGNEYEDKHLLFIESLKGLDYSLMEEIAYDLVKITEAKFSENLNAKLYAMSSYHVEYYSNIAVSKGYNKTPSDIFKTNLTTCVGEVFGSISTELTDSINSFYDDLGDHFYSVVKRRLMLFNT
ncbi:TPA: HNH endonuclease [Vibrio vulnificus]|nr:HNH endonuclease [Vibrio vulnificus]